MYRLEISVLVICFRIWNTGHLDCLRCSGLRLYLKLFFAHSVLTILSDVFRFEVLQFFIYFELDIR